jgi:hypothetical protein
VSPDFLVDPIDRMTDMKIIALLMVLLLGGLMSSVAPARAESRHGCDVTSMADIFRNPPSYFGKHFCGEVLAVPDEGALKIFPPGRVPSERNDVVLFLDRATFDALGPVGSRPFRLYLEGEVNGMDECFQPTPPGHSSSDERWSCTPFQHPLDIRVSRFRRLDLR